MEIWVNGESLHLDDNSWAILKILDEDGLVELLQHRTGKTESEVRDLLESLSPSYTEMIM